MAKGRNNTTNNEPWYAGGWGRFLTGVAILAAGYGAGQWKASYDHSLEMIKKDHECVERLNQKDKEFQECQIAHQNEKLIEIMTFVKTVSRKSGR